MAIDPSKISIISAQKVSVKDFGENRTVRLPDAQLPKAIQKELKMAQLAAEAPEQRCHVCCMAQGMIISLFTCLAVSGVGLGVFIMLEKRTNYTINGLMRQLCWLCIPGVLCGTTLHYFLVESMWSNKRSSYGQAWTKALFANSFIWYGGIGLGTLIWRKGMKLTAFGRTLYHKYPVPSTQLETRMVQSGKGFIANMGWSYWALGCLIGQFGFGSAVSFVLWNDRVHFLMNPHGGYAKRCLPKWRRDAIESRVIK